jgi:AAA+ ATPase superfamily predicted ATPase
MNDLIGRVSEKNILEESLNSSMAELIAVYGRRRVGKTYLIRTVYEREITFEISGVHNEGLSQQLENFTSILTEYAGTAIPFKKPKNWFEAFGMLQKYLEQKKTKNKKQVIFFDEFPWLNTHKSRFLSAFEHFWNSWASRQNNLIVVICGSAASWMIQKVIRNKGGLHNRVTRRMRLIPFNLSETEEYLKSKRIKLDRYQIIQLYMVMGGIPHYLKEIKVGQSFIQIIDNICFDKDGLLNDEFKSLYISLFDNATNHINVVRALAKKTSGLNRNEIIDVCKLSTGGGTSVILEELEESGFITSYIPFNKKSNEIIYKLTDEYSLFYLKFIESNRNYGEGTWTKKSQSSSWRSWSGLAFETICLTHIKAIKKALGISGIYSEESIWRFQGNKENEGTQIDLIIDRQDSCINVCEIKFSKDEFIIDKKYANELEQKLKVFERKTKTKKTLFLTMISTYGVKENEYKVNLIQQNIKMDSLFDGK